MTSRLGAQIAWSVGFAVLSAVLAMCWPAMARYGSVER